METIRKTYNDMENSNDRQNSESSAGISAEIWEFSSSLLNDALLDFSWLHHRSYFFKL